MINFKEYKKTLELETIEIFTVKLDVYFSYTSDFGFQIESIEDITGAQDLIPILSNAIVDYVYNELTELYRNRGWL
jgi:hypothetical protein